jgi:hypothetical protein
MHGFKCINNKKGAILWYALAVFVVSEITIQYMITRSINMSTRQAALQRSTDATMFMKGLEVLLASPLICSNVLGNGYHTVASPATANNFDPNLTTNQPVVIRDPSGAQNVMHEAYTGTPAATAPAISLAAQGLVIRGISLLKDQGTAANISTDSLTTDPFDPSIILPVPVTVRLVSGSLVLDLESVNNRLRIQRRIPLTIYAESPIAGGPWKVASCTVGKSGTSQAGWADVNEIGAISNPGSVSCPLGSYGIGMAATWNGTDPVGLTMRCARVRR